MKKLTTLMVLNLLIKALHSLTITPSTSRGSNRFIMSWRNRFPSSLSSPLSSSLSSPLVSYSTTRMLYTFHDTLYDDERPKPFQTMTLPSSLHDCTGERERAQCASMYCQRTCISTHMYASTPMHCQRTSTRKYLHQQVKRTQILLHIQTN